MNKTSLVNDLQALTDVINGEDIHFTNESKILSTWIASLSSPIFPVAVIGEEGKSRLLDQLYSREENLKEKWENLDIQIHDLKKKDVVSLGSSKAFMFVVDAVHIFSQAERAMLSALLCARPPYQAIIVINNIDDVEEVDEVKDWVRKVLNPYFLNEVGALDEEMYAQHVFFVDRRDVRSMERLQDRLNVLFSDEKKRSLSEMTAAVQMTLYIVGATQQRINGMLLENQKSIDKILLDRKQIGQQTGKQQNDEKLLTQKLDDIQEKIRSKVYRSLVRYLDGMDAEWESRASMILDASPLEIKDLLGAFVSSKRMETLQIVINKNVQNYLRIEFQKWSNQLSEELEPEFTELAELQIKIGEFKMSSMTNVFASSRYQKMGRLVMQGLIQKMSQNILLGGRSIDQTMLRFLIRGILFYFLVFSRTTTLRFTGLVTFLGSETLSTNQEVENFRNDLLKQLRQHLLGNLRHALTKSSLNLDSFRDIDAFMTTISKQESILIEKIYTSLSLNIRQTLKKSSYLDDEKNLFLTELNTSISKWPRFSKSELKELSISPETQHTMLKDPDITRGHRLLLAEAFPDFVYESLQDRLYSYVDYQIAQAVSEWRTIVNEQKNVVEDAVQRTTIVATDIENELHARRIKLQEASIKIQNHFDALAIAVYGKTFSLEEISIYYNRKHLLFGELSDEQ